MSALVEICDRVREAAAHGRALRIRGAGTKDFYGQALDGEVLDTGAYSGIVAFEPTELVVTARCGTPLSELEAALAHERQMLAFEPPAFGDGATVGGMVAAGLSGPRRAAAGSVRDYLLGAAMVDASGQLNRFGGQVMKNVAGYDVSRLLCGSLGVLGLIAAVSLKVLPVPAAQATLSITMSEADALRCLNEWAGQPLPITASAWHASTLRLRMSGAAAAVQTASDRFVKAYGAAQVAPDAADAYWSGVREQTDEFFAGEEPLWRLSLPSVAPALVAPGRQLIEWGGALRWLKTTAGAAEVRAAVRGMGGSATLFRGVDKSAGVFEPLAAPVAAVHRRLKQQFDPKGIFNPGRMYPEF
jgi:glycolate oxidase FAD binding subunit